MYLGIDVGTSSVKAVLIDDQGQLFAQGSAPLTVERPEPLWSEQDPDAWWRATVAAVRALPPFRPICSAIQRDEPNTPDNRAGK